METARALAGPRAGRATGSGSRSWVIVTVTVVVRRFGLADQGLRDQEPLLLSSRELSNGARGVVGRADPLDRGRDPLSLGPAARECPARDRHGNSPPGALEAEPDEVDAANPGLAIEAVALRQIADLRTGLPGRASEHTGRSAGEGDQSEQG